LTTRLLGGSTNRDIEPTSVPDVSLSMTASTSCRFTRFRSMRQPMAPRRIARQS
jgi:hypothetical protein